MSLRTYRIFASSTQDNPVINLRCDVVDKEISKRAIELNEISVIGQLSNSSNSAMIGEIEIDENTKISVIIKSAMYENPLRDFEWGTLVKREVAAYSLSETLGWDIVPVTCLRDVRDMQCSVQLFVPHNPRNHYFNFVQKQYRDIEKFVLFDYITNNADRKAGHILQEIPVSYDLYLDGETKKEDSSNSGTNETHLYGIDHGLSFHVEDKLRTVIWEYAEKPIDALLLEDIHVAQSKVAESIAPYLTEYEVQKTIERIDYLLMNPYHRAVDVDSKSFPWPLV